MSEVFIFGDSIVWGASDPLHGGWAQLIKAEIDTLQTSRPTLWCPVFNLGVPGDTAAHVARRIEAEIAARHDPSQCAVILVGVGINDSTSIISSGAGVVSPTEYTEALDTIRAVAARFNAKLGLIGLTPVHEKFVNPVPWLPTHAYTTARAHLFEQTRASYCARRKIPSVELWSSWLSYDWHSLLHDGLHPNTAGHDLNYRLIRPLLFDHFRVCDY